MSTTWTPAHWTQTADTWIDKITIPSGISYDLVDSEARSKIDSLGTYTTFLGVTTTDLTDGATSPVVTIGGNSVTASTGNIVLHTISTTAGRIAEEFIYADGKWHLFGDISADNLGNLAYKNSASTSYRPAGTISTTTGILTSKGKFTPIGSVAFTTTGAVAKLSTTSTKPTGTNTANFLFYKPAGAVTVTNASSTTVSTITVLRGIAGKTVMSSISTTAPGENAPTGGVNYTNVNDHNLKLQYLVQNTTNAINSTSSGSVVSGVTLINAATATFAGTEIYFQHPSIDVPVAATFTGTASTVTVTGTVITGASFSGTTATITVS